MSVIPRSEALSRWQQTTLWLLFIGYTGYYVCRSNLSVATPLIIEQFKAQGIDKAAIGGVVSIGTTFYALGKLFNGILCDFLGGRRMFILGMLASVVCTVAFGLSSGVLAFTLFWSLNRFFQSTGWAALIKVCARWFGFESYGKVMAFLSLSFLWGNAAVKWFLGLLIENRLGWRELFFTAAAILLTIAIANLLFLKAGPGDVGLEEPAVRPDNLFGADGEKVKPEGLLPLLAPFFRSPVFWIVLLLSFGLTLIRETFGAWTPTYLVEVAKVTKGQAAQYSAAFDLAGGFSVLACGFLTDRFFRGRRSGVMVGFLALSVVALLALSRVQTADPFLLVALISAVAFLTIGPYSFLGGAISLDLGGRQGSSAASGIIDSAGYLGGIFSGYAVAKLAERSGWGTAFLALTILSGLMVVGTWIYGRYESRPPRSSRS